ncbi:hypothetical protein [Edwardsiella tarda]|uniref:dual OB domain-containing protein n=1 Tax=Edwardsiella tarda TaxID=636 RepID=UPI00351C60E7
MSSMRLVLLAASAKRKHYCLAGRKWHEGETHLWIRPVGNSLPDDNDALTTGEIQFIDYKIPQLLDVVEVNLLRKANHPVQGENFLIDTSFRWEKVGTIPVNKLDQFVEYPDTLWFNPKQHDGVNDRFPYHLIHGQTNSLYFILIENLVIRVSHSSYDGRKRYHGLFEYNKINYKLSITDTKIYSTYGQKADGDYHYGKCYATLSMALFRERNECYKFLAALIKI